MYEVTQGAATAALQGSSTTVFNEDTIAKILALATQDNNNVRFDEVTATGGEVTVAAGAGVVIIDSSATQQTQITAPANAPVLIFKGTGGVDATFDNGPSTVEAGAGVVERVVIHSDGADNFVIADGANTQITIGEGDTVTGGAGNDTVIAGFGDSTVVGGTGYTIVQMAGNDTDYEVTVVDGRAVVTNTVTGSMTDISNSQFVQLDDGEALVFAKDSLEAAVSTLYETAFGRAPDADGLKFWFDRAQEGLSLEEIADAFTQVAEFTTIAARDDEAFIEAVYQQTFGRAADETGMAFWLNQLESGVDRSDVLESFAELSAAHIDGTVDGETTIIGSVTIVPGIV